MNAESRITVHYSSLVDLKAELLRKQVEVEAVKVRRENAKSIDNKSKASNKKVNEKPKSKKLHEIKKENQEDIESMKMHKKSQLMLKAKSRLYEKLSKTRTNMNPNFLVDFEHKPDNLNHSEDESFKDDNDYNSDHDSDSEWLEYTDCFGRTRKCLREDLPKMQEKDEFLRKTIIEKPSDETKDKPLYIEDRIPEKEPEIEMMRRKWEEQTAKLAQKADIHYQDVLFDEARTHGVGYYAFSQDEEERAKQQDDLLKLRRETEQKQKENHAVREMKDKMQQNRLRVARLRQRVRAGLPIETEEEMAEKQKDNEMQEILTENKETKKEKRNQTDDSEESKKQEIAKAKLEEIENKVQAFGELLGKRNKFYVMSQEEWVNKRRKERTEEFAPMYTNFAHGGSLILSSSSKFTSHKDSTNSNDHLNSDDPDSIGPIPRFSDESSIIGPMPISEAELDIIGPMPPLSHITNSTELIEEVATIPKDSTANTYINVEDQIEAGLKYLRQQFESKCA